MQSGYGGQVKQPPINITHCDVLVVDDDPDCLEEYVEMVRGLGYGCKKAGSPIDALRKIAEDGRIGIVITDLDMPAMDGLAFLDEVAARFASVKPMVTLMVTGFGTMDHAVQAMRANAVDFLAKPVSRDSLRAALRRAARQWAVKVGQFRLAALTAQTEMQSGALPPESGTGDRPSPPQDNLKALARSIVRSRQQRVAFLDPNIFADPAWDILLDLTSAKLEGKPVAVSSACAATTVPMSTALRHIRHLVDSGMLKRWSDPTDRRRDLLELTDEAMNIMLRYLESISSTMAFHGNR